MSKLQITGGNSLFGELEVQGSKNAVLPIMAAALLHKGITVIQNVPCISDVLVTIEILKALGASVTFDGYQMVIDASVLTSCKIPAEYVTQIRSSVIFLGALLARCKEVYTCQPGGCSIGKRPINWHLEAFRKLGAEIMEDEENLYAKATNLYASEIHFACSSVGATENILLAATAARGVTVIHQAAREPEVMELCWFLQTMGAEITGIGSPCLTVKGGCKLKDTVYCVSSDRIVAGTYLCACVATGGKVILRKAPVAFMQSTLRTLALTGAEITTYEDNICCMQRQHPLPIAELCTQVYPGFPTDMQSLMLAVLCMAEGTSSIYERIFEGRFAIVEQLQKMGADIEVLNNNRKVVIRGNGALTGAAVKASDLRAGAALAVAALAAKGESTIEQYHYIARGYVAIAKDLKQLGGNICLID